MSIGSTVVPVPIGDVLRRRRQEMGLTLRQAAKLTTVALTVICEIEGGKRTPSVATLEKLVHGLGLALPATVLTRPAPPATVTEEQLSRLAACLLVTGGRVELASLADGCGISIPAVREQLALVAPRLAAVGLVLAEDSVEVEVRPAPWTRDAVREVLGAEVQRALSDEAVTLLAFVGHSGETTRRAIEGWRGGDCESLLRRLVQRGLLNATLDESLPGNPLRYRLTTTALAALGCSSLEELRGRFDDLLAEQRTRADATASS